MIRHIIKLIWNRKRSLAWIFIEQVLVFGILLLCFTNAVESVTRHFSKGNINLDNIAIINVIPFDKNSLDDEEDKEGYYAQINTILERVKNWPSVELISINGQGAVPTMGSHKVDTISFNERRFGAYIKYCDENYPRVFPIKITEGQWFRNADASLEISSALITQRLAERMGFTGSAIGQTVHFNGRVYRIAGIVEALKDRPEEEAQAAMFIPYLSYTDVEGNMSYAVKFKSGMYPEFAKAYIEEFYRYFPRDQYMPMLAILSQMSGMLGFFSLIKVYMLGIPTAFLLIFAFMGTFGVIWVQSKKRMGELGLRIALGCTPARLMRTIILENLILTSFAMLPGLIVIAGLYAYSLSGWEWMAAVGAAIVMMWLFSAVSAWYPARQAAKVQPVEALKANQ